MRTDGVFSSHRFEIKFDKFNEPIYLIPFGDVHKSSPMHSASHWQEFLEWAKTKKRAYFLGCGDYNDIGSTSERRILNDPNLHDSTTKTIEQLYLKQTMAFCKDIEFMKGRLIGIMGGNHFGQFQSGITTDQKIAEVMGSAYLGCNTFVKLVLEQSTKRTSLLCLDIFAHHGRGGGRTAGGSMNPVQQMMNIAEADIYLMGDNHQKAVTHVSRLRLISAHGKLFVRQRKILLARTGSFLKGYEEGEKSYIVDANLPPTDLGVVKIELTPRREVADGIEKTYVDIHASI